MSQIDDLNARIAILENMLANSAQFGGSMRLSASINMDGQVRSDFISIFGPELFSADDIANPGWLKFYSYSDLSALAALIKGYQYISAVEQVAFDLQFVISPIYGGSYTPTFEIWRYVETVAAPATSGQGIVLRGHAILEQLASEPTTPPSMPNTDYQKLWAQSDGIYAKPYGGTAYRLAFISEVTGDPSEYLWWAPQ